MVFSWVCTYFPSIFISFGIISACFVVGNGETRVSSAKERLGPEMTSPIDALTHFDTAGVEIFCPSLTIEKVFDFLIRLDFPIGGQ